jgi:tetratricopeptide (TPR) repeat protein
LAALSEIEKLEARWAENPDGRYFAPLADAYRKAGRVDDAIQVVTQGLVKHPDYLSAHIVLGRCHLEKKDDAQAGSAFEKVLSLDAENIIALKSLAEIAERTGRPDDARQWLQRLLTIDAMNTDAAEDLARLGGPLPETEEQPAPAPEAEAGGGFSFADVMSDAAEPELVVPKTLEQPAIDLAALFPPAAAPVAAAAPPEPPHHVSPDAVTAPMAALDLEPTAFEPPPPPEHVTAAPDIMPFDDKLAWGGAGERQSRSVHAKDIQEAIAHHEQTAAAIDFLGAAASGSPAPAESEAEAAAAPGEADWSGAPEVPTLDLDAVGAAPPGGFDSGLDEAQSEPTIDLGAAPEEGAVEPEPAVHAAPDLPLIMPEDVTPAEELRRPSLKQVQMVSAEPAEVPEAPSEPMVTETMADLYARQGLKDQAADVYRRLLVARPEDAGLRAKLTAIESPPALSAAALGAEAVGAWLQRIARASLRTNAPSPPPAPAEGGPSPMEQAFAAAPAPVSPEPQADAAAPAGQPARPATDQFSLDQIFGSGGQASGAPGAAGPGAAPHALGSSFDEFFGSGSKPDAAPPGEAGSGRPSEDDLSAFTTWLHGLKR